MLEPTLPIVPYERGPGYDRGHAGGPGDPMIALTALWDMTGMPVASLPVSWEIGVSLIAPRGHEAPLVQAAIDLQESRARRPGLAVAEPIARSGGFSLPLVPLRFAREPLLGVSRDRPRIVAAFARRLRL